MKSLRTKLILFSLYLVPFLGWRNFCKWDVVLFLFTATTASPDHFDNHMQEIKTKKNKRCDHTRDKCPSLSFTRNTLTEIFANKTFEPPCLIVIFMKILVSAVKLSIIGDLFACIFHKNVK